MMQMRDGEAPKRKLSRYTVRPGTLGLTLIRFVPLQWIDCIQYRKSSATTSSSNRISVLVQFLERPSWLRDEWIWGATVVLRAQPLGFTQRAGAQSLFYLLYKVLFPQRPS
jgi:hypothetical protein